MDNNDLRKVDSSASCSRVNSGGGALWPTAYGTSDLNNLLRATCAGKSVHVSRAGSNPIERLATIVGAGIERLVLSDLNANLSLCMMMALMLTDRWPGLEIDVVSLDPDDYWQCRSMKRTDLIIDFGSLIHNPAPDRLVSRLALLTDGDLFLTSMVIPQTANSNMRDGRMLSAKHVAAGSIDAEALSAAFSQHGVLLPQLKHGAGSDNMWAWFPTPAALMSLARATRFTEAVCSYIWSDVAVAVTYTVGTP